jgi:hypothetical protein
MLKSSYLCHYKINRNLMQKGGHILIFIGYAKQILKLVDLI